MRIAFVILHYKTYKDTIKCVNSINSLKGEKMVIIVDNNSQNGSFEIVKNKFNIQKNIYFIQNKKNLGFASGNNIGYKFAKNTLNSDLVIICNNDIIFNEKNFLMNMVVDYKRTNFDIAGPDIESLENGMHQNPMIQKKISNIKLEIEIFKYKILYLLSKLNIYNFLKGKIFSKEVKKNKNYLNEMKNVMLHGSILIFSRRFIQKEKYAFCPGTFLYLEENLLFEYCQIKGYVTFYFPNLHVFHEEDASTNVSVNNLKAKRELVFLNMIRSFKVLRKQRIKYNLRFLRRKI